MIVIRLTENPDHSILVDGPFLKSFDFEAFNGLGEASYTRDATEALLFPDAEAALAFCHTQSKTLPVRSDGNPNRPLSALAVEIEEAPAP